MSKNKVIAIGTLSVLRSTISSVDICNGKALVEYCSDVGYRDDEENWNYKISEFTHINGSVQEIDTHIGQLFKNTYENEFCIISSKIDNRTFVFRSRDLIEMRLDRYNNTLTVSTRNSKDTKVTRTFRYETSDAYSDLGVFNEELNKLSRRYYTDASFAYHVAQIRLDF